MNLTSLWFILVLHILGVIPKYWNWILDFDILDMWILDFGFWILDFAQNNGLVFYQWCVSHTDTTMCVSLNF
jgi:hypothetical protein